MNRVARSDRLTVDLSPAGGAVYHENGWIDAPAYAPIVGTFDYPEFGTVEHVPPEEALDPESLATLKGIPITIDHPAGMVDADNAQVLTHGVVLDYAPRGNEGVDLMVRIWTRDAAAAKRQGKAQLSFGYDAKLDATPGVDASGRRYTGIQRGRRYNHLAMVDLARIGGDATLRFDAMTHAKLKIGPQLFAIAPLLATALKGAAIDPAKRKDEGLDVAEIVIDGVTLVVPRAVVDQIVAMLTGQPPAAAAPAVDEAPVVDPTMQDPTAPPRLDGMDPKLAALVRTLVRAEVAPAIERATARLDAEGRRRMEVERAAGEILGPTFSYADADTWGVAAAAIGHEDAKRKTEAERLAAAARKGDQLAQGRLLGHLDAAVERFQDAYQNGGELALELDKARRDGKPTAEDEDDEDGSDTARRRMLDRMHGRKPDKAKGAKARQADDDEDAA